MEYSLEGYEKLWNMLFIKLKPRINEFVFLELNKDVSPGNKISIPKDIPLPVKSGNLIEGIKSSEYVDSVKLDSIFKSMAFLIGCVEDFKYNRTYISLIKEIGSEMKDILQNEAWKYRNEGNLYDSLIYYLAIERIYGCSRDIRFNISDVLREMALKAEERHNEDDYELYYLLSFYEFMKLSKEYPDLYNTHYYLGFYYMKEKQYSDASVEWKAALSLAPGESAKVEIARLLDSLVDNINFEKGKEMVGLGSALEGIKLLIPLMQKYKEWNELKFYTALGYRKLNNYIKAKILFLELLDAGEDFPEIYNELGLCYFNMKDHKKAVECFEKAASAIEDEPSILCNLGIAYYEMGDTEKAKEKIDRAYGLAHGDELTRKCKEWCDKL